MDYFINTILPAFIAGGGAALVFSYFFMRRLESHKFELNKTFYKFSMFHEKEFKVFDTSWDKLLETYFNLGSMAAGFRSYGGPPMLSKYSSDELEKYMTENRYSSDERNSIKQHNDPDDIDWESELIWEGRILNVAHNELAVFFRYFEKNKIFLSNEITDKLYEFANMLSFALDDWKNVHLHCRQREKNDRQTDEEKNSSKNANKLYKEAKGVIKEVEQLMRKRVEIN